LPPGAQQNVKDAEARGESITRDAFAAGVLAASALLAAQSAPRGTDAQILKERELTVSAIRGAMAYGYQDTNPPPSPDHWLAEFWNIGREHARAAQSAPVVQPVPPNPMTLAEVHQAIHDAGGTGFGNAVYFPRVEQFIAAAVLCREHCALAAAPAPSAKDYWIATGELCVVCGEGHTKPLSIVSAGKLLVMQRCDHCNSKFAGQAESNFNAARIPAPRDTVSQAEALRELIQARDAASKAERHFNLNEGRWGTESAHKRASVRLTAAWKAAEAVAAAPSAGGDGKDAARYRWLRDDSFTMSPADNYKPWCARVDRDGLGNELLYGEELDAAIDAAMQPTKAQT
jgi:hypothetical protein